MANPAHLAAAAAAAVAAGVNEDAVVAVMQALGVGGGNNAVNNEPERDIKLKVLESTDPQSWLQWRARFENIARCKGWNDAQQRRALAQAMSGKAIEATQHVQIEAHGGKPALTAVQALDAYEAKFVTQAGTTQARSEFLAASQGKDESLPAWHTRVSTLYRRAHPGVNIDDNRELLERFCLGMWDSKIADRTLTDQPATMAQALNDASRHLATKVTMERRADVVRGQGGRGGANVNSIKPKDNAANSAIEKKKMKCFFCKKLGHPKRDCFAFKRFQEGRQGEGKATNQGDRSKAAAKTGGGGSSLNALASYLEAALGEQGAGDGEGSGQAGVAAVDESSAGN